MGVDTARPGGYWCVEFLLRGTPRSAECAAAVLVLFCVLTGCGPSGDETPTRPNVVLVVVDTFSPGPGAFCPSLPAI